MPIAISRLLPRLLAAALLLIISALGGYNGIDAWLSGEAKTALQQSVTIGNLIYGMLGLAAGAGVLAGRRWGYLISIAWGIVISYTGAMASHAYGETTAPVTALAFLATACIAGIIVGLANLGTRNR